MEVQQQWSKDRGDKGRNEENNDGEKRKDEERLKRRKKMVTQKKKEMGRLKKKKDCEGRETTERGESVVARLKRFS